MSKFFCDSKSTAYLLIQNVFCKLYLQPFNSCNHKIYQALCMRMKQGTACFSSQESVIAEMTFQLLFQSKLYWSIRTFLIPEKQGEILLNDLELFREQTLEFSDINLSICWLYCRCLSQKKAKWTIILEDFQGSQTISDANWKLKEIKEKESHPLGLSQQNWLSMYSKL